MVQHKQVEQKYNTMVGEEYHGEYESRRWFSNPIQAAAFWMTKRSIERVLPSVSFSDYLELGPGPGTWTQLFLRRQPDADVTLLDISKEMIAAAKNRLPVSERISYIVSDILNADLPGDAYDYFFSSRAIEYVSDKEKLFETIAKTLRPSGRGMIITKMPKYARAKMLKRSVSDFHSGQISYGDLRRLLEAIGFKDILCRPVTVSVPLLHSPAANKLLFRLVSRLPMNPFTALFTESYSITFTKA